MTIHVVRPGETVDAIARSYGVNPEMLAADNQVPSDGALAVGQTLVVRFPRQVHGVVAGDTLSSIAARYGVTVRQLWQNNWSLGGGTDLTPGQTLVVSTWSEKAGAALVNGYAYPFIDSALLRAQLPFLSCLTPFTYGIGPDGALFPLADGALRAAALTHGVKNVLHLSTYTEQERFDTQRAELVLTDSAAQERLLSDLRRVVEQKKFSGIDVDFEFLPAALADDYAAFITRLRRQFSALGLFVWVALAPKTSAAQPGLLYEGHDYAALGAAADGALVMTYEWGYTYGPPLAVAPLPNVRAVLDYAVTEIPAGKLFLGVPNYGYDWPLPFRQGETKAQSISNRRAIELAVRYGVAIQFDETAQAPFFHYTAPDGIIHEVWFEDARSMEAKLLLIAQYGLRGAGVWNLMRPFSQIWLTLAELYEIETLP